MDEVFVIGLPVSLKVRLDAVARKEGLSIVSVLTDIGKEGTFRLLPDPSVAIHKLKSYYGQFGSDLERACVIVLPYAEVPDEVEQELAVLESIGGEVEYISRDDSKWPTFSKKKRPDTVFYNDIFRCIKIEIFGDEEELLSDYVRRIVERNKNIILIEGALDTCDQVARHRHAFIKDSIDAFAQFIERKGKVGRIDAFFRERGLDHAQTGGIATTLTVEKAGRQIHSNVSHTHLKDGDKTLKVAAARVYYQDFVVEDECYVAVLYAGIHPDNNIKKNCSLDC